MWIGLPEYEISFLLIRIYYAVELTFVRTWVIIGSIAIYVEYVGAQLPSMGHH
jgi:hypothetical protein